MSYAIVFSSKTGNTELLADTLHSCLPQAECCYFGQPELCRHGSGHPLLWVSGRIREKQMRVLRSF